MFLKNLDAKTASYHLVSSSSVVFVGAPEGIMCVCRCYVASALPHVTCAALVVQPLSHQHQLVLATCVLLLLELSYHVSCLHLLCLKNWQR